MPNKWRWRNWPFAVKLTVVMTGMVLATIVLLSLLSIWREQRTFQQELEQQALLILNVLENTIEDELYLLDVDDISDVMGKLTDREDLFTHGRVYDADGRIVVDAFDDTLTFQNEANPLGLQLLSTEETVMIWEDDQLLAGKALVVGNQPFGAISVGLPTSALQAKLMGTRNQGLTVAIVAALLGTAVAILFSQSFNRPIKELVKTTHRFSEGDFSQTAIIEREDEIGELSYSMEAMRNELQLLYTDLEGQVATRSKDLIIARDQALEANRLKTELLARASHELRTPLNAILGYSEMLDEQVYGQLNEKQHTLAQRVINNANSLTVLINELLDQAQLEAGKLKLNFMPVSLKDMAERIQNELEGLAQQKDLVLTTAVSPNMPEQLMADSVRIYQIMTNLVGNAIKFTEKGSVDVNIVLANKTNWAIVVSDTGQGIPEEAQARIFEPFRQVDGTVTRLHGGTGLGLSIAKELTELMAGKIELISEVGKGSTFTVTLPLIPVKAEVANE